MKTKLILLSLTGFLFVCCTGNKSVTSTNKNIPKEVVLSPELIEGKALFEGKCVKCHKLYDPKKFSQEEWKPVLVKMQKKAHLDDAQMALISNYISSQL